MNQTASSANETPVCACVYLCVCVNLNWIYGMLPLSTIKLNSEPEWEGHMRTCTYMHTGMGHIRSS